MKKKKGFTLVELLIVIAILAILSTVSIIGYSKFTENAKQSTYLQYAKANFDKYYADRLGDIEEGTYIFVEDKENEDNGAWFAYSNGELVAIETEPEEASYYYQLEAGETADYLDENVKIVKPTTVLVVERLNKLLTGSATTYETLADVGKTIIDDEMDAINYGAYSKKYRIVYSLTENNMYIANNDLSAILYPKNTAKPSDIRIVTGANINTAQDLVKFSEISNKHDNGVPKTENIYLTSHPIVLLNLNKNIVFDLDSPQFEPIANWHGWFEHNYSSICVLLNGNNNTISNLNNTLIGAMDLGSRITHININYAIGSLNNNLSNFNKDKINNKGSDASYLFGLISNSVFKRDYVCKPMDTIVVDDVSIGGNVYLAAGSEKSAHHVGILFGMLKNNNTNGTMLSITNCNLFANDSDHIEAINNSGNFNILVGNPESISNITYDSNSIHYSSEIQFYVKEYASFATAQPWFGPIA